MLCCNFYLSNWFHCPNALQLYHIFLICVNILWKITSWSRVSFLFLPCILIYALLDRFLSDHTIDYPVADSHPLKHAFFPSASILLEKIHTSFFLVGFTRHVHVLVCFSMTVHLFMPLLTKMWDPPLLFTPSIGQVGRVQVKTYPYQNVPNQNVPNFGQNVPTFLVKTYPVHQNVPNLLVKTYPIYFFLIYNIILILLDFVGL